MAKFRYLSILLLICLLTIDHSESWRRRRFRRFTRRVGRAIRRVRRTIQTVNTAVGVIRAVGAIAGAGKRSADDLCFEKLFFRGSSRNVCDFSTLDLDKDYDVDEEELTTLIQMSGLEELDDLFEKLDKDGDKKITQEEFDSSDIIDEICSEDEKEDKQIENEDAEGTVNKNHCVTKYDIGRQQ